MRTIVGSRTLALSALLAGLSGCMEPRYPDDFEENVQAVWGTEAGLPSPVVGQTAPRPGVDSGASGLLPIAPGSAPVVDAGRNDPLRAADAGMVPPGVRPDPG
ncbi:MAG TPA: hypothetical protein VMF89_29850, partial [Polyangiales bacterium]|nr:hypothetical protein [Polyangiales bacterium]